MSIEDANRIRQQRLAALREQVRDLPVGPLPLTLEIGCGHGHFLTAYATDHPTEYCLGVDILRDRLERAARKTARVGLTNVRWIQADILDLLEVLPPAVRINRHVLVLFPDPWPKRRHWKNRLMQMPFLNALATRCEPETRLCFRTDHPGYFATAHAVVADHPEWRLSTDEPWPFERQTVFEARAPSFSSLIAKRIS